MYTVHHNVEKYFLPKKFKLLIMQCAAKPVPKTKKLKNFESIAMDSNFWLILVGGSDVECNCCNTVAAVDLMKFSLIVPFV